MSLLRQNYLSEQMLKTHPHEVIGYLTCTVRMDPGLVSIRNCALRSRRRLMSVLNGHRTLTTNWRRREPMHTVMVSKSMIT